MIRTCTYTLASVLFTVSTVANFAVADGNVEPPCGETTEIVSNLNTANKKKCAKDGPYKACYETLAHIDNGKGCRVYFKVDSVTTDTCTGTISSKSEDKSPVGTIKSYKEGTKTLYMCATSI